MLIDIGKCFTLRKMMANWNSGFFATALCGCFCFLLFGSCASPQAQLHTPYLEAATEVGTWLVAQADADGRIPNEALPDTVFSASLGSGAGGRMLFFLELFQATQDSAYLARAQSESEFALVYLKDSIDDPSARFGLYNGVAGVVFALSEMERITGNDLLSTSLPTLTQRMHEAAENDPVNDVIVGIAGIGLELLDLAKRYNDSALVYAVTIGDTLLRRGMPAGQGGYWNRSEDMDLNLPNFSHGTAGVGYFLARLYEETRQPAYLAGAEQAAQYLMDIADQKEGRFLVPYGIPNEGLSTKFDIGWAHGPPGTARLFYLLWQLTEKDVYWNHVESNVRSIVASGVPNATKDSLLWTGPFRIDQRFGTSGAATFLLKMHGVRSESQYLTLGRLIVDDILEKSSNAEVGRYWVLSRYGFQGQRGESASYTGYFYGAAGLGLALLQMHYADVSQPASIVFPDDPF